MLSSAEIAERAEAMIARRLEKFAQARPPRSKISAATRRRLADATRDHYARLALADPNCPPVKRLRLEKRWTLAQAAAHAGVALNTVWAAENRPERVSRKTWRALSRGYGRPVYVLRR